MKQVMTICFLIRQEGGQTLICLANKRRGFRAGKLNGYGGKLQKETPLECAIRETVEESGVIPTTLHKHAIITFDDVGNIFECHVYVCRSWVGMPVETEEMTPYWFELDKIPYERMGVTDHLWLSPILDGKCCIAYFQFNAENVLLKSDLQFVESVE